MIKKNHIVKLKSSASESGEDYPCYNSNKNNNKKNNKNPHQNLTWCQDELLDEQTADRPGTRRHAAADHPGAYTCWRTRLEAV